MATALISLLFPVKQLRRIVEKAYKMSGNFAMKTNWNVILLMLFNSICSMLVQPVDVNNAGTVCYANVKQIHKIKVLLILQD